MKTKRLKIIQLLKKIINKNKVVTDKDLGKYER